MRSILIPWCKEFFESIDLPGIKAEYSHGSPGHVWVELELTEDFNGNIESLCEQYYEICMQQAPVGCELTVTARVSSA